MTNKLLCLMRDLLHLQYEIGVFAGKGKGKGHGEQLRKRKNVVEAEFLFLITDLLIAEANPAPANDLMKRIEKRVETLEKQMHELIKTIGKFAGR